VNWLLATIADALRYYSIKDIKKGIAENEIVGLTRDLQTVGYVHVGSEIFIRAGAH
jgi:hypothetical protein